MPAAVRYTGVHNNCKPTAPKQGFRGGGGGATPANPLTIRS